MKITKSASFILLLTVAVFLVNGYAEDLPTRIDIGEGPVNAIAYSRSVNRLAVAAANNIHIYDAGTYKEVMVLAGHTDSVLAIAFSPNGKLLVSGSSDKTVRLWEADTGKLRRTREEHTAPVSTVVFSVNGKKFWSGSSEDDTIRSWYPRDGGRWSSETSPRRDVDLMAIACSYQGETIARVITRNQTTIVLRGGRNHWTVKTGHTDPVNVLTLYADGKTLATGSADKTIELWNKADTDKPLHKPLHTLIGHTGGITAMDFWLLNFLPVGVPIKRCDCGMSQLGSIFVNLLDILVKSVRWHFWRTKHLQEWHSPKPKHSPVAVQTALFSSGISIKSSQLISVYLINTSLIYITQSISYTKLTQFVARGPCASQC